MFITIIIKIIIMIVIIVDKVNLFKLSGNEVKNTKLQRYLIIKTNIFKWLEYHLKIKV